VAPTPHVPWQGYSTKYVSSPPKDRTQNLISLPTFPETRSACCHGTMMNRSHLLTASTSAKINPGKILLKISGRPFVLVYASISLGYGPWSPIFTNVRAFMGDFRDTVASVGLIYGHSLPFTAVNSAVRVFRHALSFDEVPSYSHGTSRLSDLGFSAPCAVPAKLVPPRGAKRNCQAQGRFRAREPCERNCRTTGTSSRRAGSLVCRMPFRCWRWCCQGQGSSVTWKYFPPMDGQASHSFPVWDKVRREGSEEGSCRRSGSCPRRSYAIGCGAPPEGFWC